jgi:thiol:disulfide interchange protein DsbD
VALALSTPAALARATAQDSPATAAPSEAAPAPAAPSEAVGTSPIGEDIPAGNTLVKATATPVTLGPNGHATTTVTLSILPGWHVNSNPPAQDYFIPTKVFVRGAFGVQPGSPVYPAPHKVKLAFEESEMWVWDGETRVTLPFVASPSPGNGVHLLRGRVNYQGCNNQVCVAPTSVPFTVEVTVTGGVDAGFDSTGRAVGQVAAAEDTTAGIAPEAEPARGAGFVTERPAGGDASGAGTAAERRLQEKLGQGLWVWLAWMFAWGLALNLTPCVFPMLSITVSIFGARRKEATAKVVANAVVYVLGICVTYSVLGMVAAITGKLFGAALQIPLVNVGIGVLLLALSLSSFGVYEMQAPTWVLDKAGGANTGSIAGLFVSGLAVGIVAAPCVGPIVVALLVTLGQRGDVGFGFASMFTLSLGLGFPYLFLATFSSLMQNLPRSGEWMEWVKKLFGVVLATWGTNYVLLGLARGLAPYLIPSALVLAGLYLGFMEKSGSRLRTFKLVKNVGGALAVAAGVWLMLQVTTATSRSIPFRPYDEKLVRASLAGGRGVLLDFSADWCAACHELELRTFPDPKVVAAARGFDAYRLDMSANQSPQVAAFGRRYGVKGLPTVVFLRPDGSEARGARVEGFVSAAEFVKRIEAAGAKE